MAIEGSLQSVDIQDIAQLLNINRSTGLLHIESDVVKGIIYYRDGSLVNAAAAGLDGDNAAYLLLSQNEGHFHFEIAEHDAAHVIQRSLHDLVLEAARRKDTIKRIRDSISHDNIVFLPLVDVRIPAQRKSFSEFEIKLLSMLDGQTDLKDVISRSGASDFEVVHVIYELEKKAVVKRVEVYKLLQVSPLRKLFGSKTDVQVTAALREDWIKESVIYADAKYVEIRTKNMVFGEVPLSPKPSGGSDDVMLVPKPIMAQFEVEDGEKVLVKPILYPS
ncbi:DUF4388 domain-containing protein [Acanthopleuribacter pedis]|uniref:DUF4388 domain-containing protein n=1 Tax=Acanthopleuribacter pedis TaxID=442870 RepID=A0A8J7Q627_9BACT|nr:DUF4388 domain-containing protein [Acanthopleuribacter pedis]MBO1321157.1 DUF4388 domain-containing protein [Acanthopleuribacter pedis]